MAVDTTALCTAIEAVNEGLCLPVPGGGEICFIGRAGEIPVPPNVCKDLLGRLNVNLAALAPLMCLIDVGLALVDVARATPDALGPPPNPSKLTGAIVDLVKAASCLLPLIPQLSICPIVKALLDLIIQCLIDVRDQLQNLVVSRARIASGRARSQALGGVALLDAYLDCAEEQADLLTAALSGSTESMQRMLDITVNPLLQLAGLDPIDFQAQNFNQGAPQDFIQPLQDVIDDLARLRDTLPCELLSVSVQYPAP